MALIKVDDIHIPNYMNRDVFTNHRDRTDSAKKGGIVLREQLTGGKRYVLVTGLKKLLANQTLGVAAVDAVVIK